MIPQSSKHFELEKQINDDYTNFSIFRYEYLNNKRVFLNKKNAIKFKNRIIKNKKELGYDTKLDEAELLDFISRCTKNKKDAELL